MASFSSRDTIPFTPYIETNPVDAYLKVGMYKEDQLKQGLQKVQQTVDTLTGLPIIKEEDKQYLQNRLGELKGGISKNLSGDFSDSRIERQIAGAARTIYSDPVVRNSVEGTMAAQKVDADIEQAKKDGKWNAANEYVVKNGINNWLSDKTVGSKASQYFTGYTPYTDKIEKFLKYMKDVDPTMDLSDVYRNDPKAITPDNPEGRTINPTIFKGKNAAQIQNVWNLVKSDANVQQQLQIDGQYQFRGQEPGQIYQSLGEQTKSTIDANNALILSLQAKAAVGDKQALSDVESLKAMNKEAEESLSSYAEALKTNPDAVKAALVSQQTLSSLIGAYSSKIMEENPLYKASVEASKWQRQMAEWDITNKRAEEKFQWDKGMDIANYSQKQEEILAKKKTDEGVYTPTALAPNEAIKNEFTARQDVARAEGIYTQSMRELAYNLATAAGVPPPYYKDDAKGTWEPNVGPGKDYEEERYADEVAKTFFDQAASASGVGILIKNDKTLNDLYVKGQDNYANLQAAKKIVEETEADFAPQTAQLATSLAGITNNPQLRVDLVHANIVKNKLDGWQSYEIALKQKYGENWTKGMGINFVSRGGDISSGTYGPNMKVYEAANKILDGNPSLINLVKAKEAAYQEKQKTPVGFTVTSSAANNEITRTKYAALAERISELNPESNKGEWNKLKGMLFGKAEDLKQNVYHRYLNPITEIGYVSVTGKDGTVQAPLSKAEYLRAFPQDSQASAFREKFQTKINLNRGMYTGTEYVNAYQVYQGPNSPYIVKYQVISTGSGAYKLKWWVAIPNDKVPAKIDMLINGEVMGEQNGLSQEMSEESIMAATKKLEDKNWVETNLAIKAKPKQ